MVRIWCGTLTPYCENINKHKLLEVNMMVSRKVNNVHIHNPANILLGYHGIAYNDKNVYTKPTKRKKNG